MVPRRVVGIALAAIALIAAAREAGAQPFTVTDNGQPVAGAQISAMINGIKTPLGTTNASGQVVIDPNDLNVTKGTEFAVWIKTCQDGTVQVIMAPRGERNECTDQAAQAGEECGCDPDPIGYFFWGGGPVTIDVATRTVLPTPAGGSAANVFKFGAGFDIRYMYNMTDVLDEVPGGSNADATTWAPGFQLLGEYQYRNLFAIGIDAGYSQMETEITFPAGVQTGDMDYYEIGLNAKVGVPTRGRFWPYFTGALHRTWNKADFALDGQSDHRVHKTRRDGLGAGFDFRVGPTWDLRFEGLYSSTFEDQDSDEHIRFKFALLYLFGGGLGYVTQERGGLYE